MIVGVIKIFKSIDTLTKVKLGGFIVAHWQTIVALTLISGFNFVDLPVGDLVMTISSFSVARIAKFVA